MSKASLRVSVVLGVVFVLIAIRSDSHQSTAFIASAIIAGWPRQHESDRQLLKDKVYSSHFGLIVLY